jgi:long-subunit acyl-CoA synthetase (AMP-forming)
MSVYPKGFIKDKVEKFDDLKQLVNQSKTLYGDKTYFTYREGQASHNISFNQMHEYINNLGTAFFDLGIMGQRVALLSETRFE